VRICNSSERHIVELNNDTRRLYIDIANRNERSLKTGDSDLSNKITSKTLKEAYAIQTLDGRDGNLRSEYLEASDEIAQYQKRRNEQLNTLGEISRYYKIAREFLSWIIKSEQRFAKYESEGFSVSEIKKKLKDNGSYIYNSIDEILIPLVAYGWLSKKNYTGGYRMYINFTVEDVTNEVKRAND